MQTKDITQLLVLVKAHPFLLLEKMLEEQKRLRLPADELLILQYIWLELASGNVTPSNTYLAEQSGLDVQQVQTLVVSLMQKKIIHVSTFNENGKIREEYDIDMLITRFFASEVKPTLATNQMKQFVQRVEAEFARKLSSIEIRLIEAWIYDEKMDYTMLDEALTETVLAGVKNFKYMNSILKNWQEHGKQAYSAKPSQQMQKNKHKVFTQEEKELASYDWISDLGALDE